MPGNATKPRQNSTAQTKMPAPELNDELPEHLKTTSEAKEAAEVRPFMRPGVEERDPPITGPAPDEPERMGEVESLARLLCQADGDDPDNFSNGKPRWQHHQYAARQHIAAFEYLCAARGVTMEEE